MNLIVLWKENINLQLSIIDFKERAEDSFLEERWLKKLKFKIQKINPSNIRELILSLDDLEKSKKAFINSLKDLKNESNNILEKYDHFYCSEDEKSITFRIDNFSKNRQYTLRLDEIFCMDNENIENRELAIKKSEEWILNNLVSYDFEIRDNKGNIIATANEVTGIPYNKEITNFIKELENDFEILKNYNEQTISFKQYIKKRELIPEILSRTEGEDSYLKEPSEKAVAAFSAILIEKNVLKLNPIGQYKKRLGLNKV